MQTLAVKGIIGTIVLCINAKTCRDITRQNFSMSLDNFVKSFSCGIIIALEYLITVGM